MADSRILINTTDAEDNPITIFSTDGKQKTAEQFEQAYTAFVNKQPIPKGFDVQRPGFISDVRKGFEAVNQPLQEAAPQVGSAIGSIAATSPILALAGKLGLIPPRSMPTTTPTGAAVGETVARTAAEQVNTPAKAGMAIGTAATAPFMLPATAASGAIQPLRLLANALTAGTGAAVGSASGRLATGEQITPGQVAEDFAIAATAGGLQGVLGHFATRYMTGKPAETISKEIVDMFKDRYPALTNDKRFLDIAASSPSQISRIASKLTEGIRGSVDDAADILISDIKQVLPRNLTVAQQNTFRAKARGVVRAQNDLLDGVITGDQDLSALNTGLQTAMSDMQSFIASAYPNIKNITPTSLRVEQALTAFNDKLNTYREGAQVIKLLKDSGMESGWNPLKFAEDIRGIYQRPGNSLLQEFGERLGGASGSTGAYRPITEMPAPGTAEPGGELLRKTFNVAREVIPYADKFTSRAAYRGSPVPWPAPGQITSPFGTFTTQEAIQAGERQLTERKAANEDAMKRFISKRK